MLKKTGLLLLAILPLVPLVYGLKLADGCPPEGKMAGCYGPIGKYWTIWEAQLAFQTPALLWGLLAAVLMIGQGFLFKWSHMTKLALAIGAFSTVFLIMVVFNPVIIQY